MKRDRLLVAIVSIGIGFAVGNAWHAIPMSVVSTEGTFYYEAPVDPAVTPTWPPGHYVLGRIYVGGVSPEMVGKRVVLSGSLTVQGDAETSAYPKIVARSLWAGPQVASPQGSAEASAHEPVPSRQ
jgi:hypothetical protein